MKAINVLPDGKYYHTYIELPEYKEKIEIWFRGANTNPSERQLEQWGCPCGMCEPGRCDNVCDSHYETQSCFELCERITKALNDESEETSSS